MLLHLLLKILTVANDVVITGAKTQYLENLLCDTLLPTMNLLLQLLLQFVSVYADCDYTKELGQNI